MDTKPPYAGQTRSDNFMDAMELASDAYKSVFDVRPRHMYGTWRDWLSDDQMAQLCAKLMEAAACLVQAEQILSFCHLEAPNGE